MAEDTQKKQDPLDAYFASRDEASDETPSVKKPAKVKVDPLDAFFSQRDAQDQAESKKRAAQTPKLNLPEIAAGYSAVTTPEETLTERAAKAPPPLMEREKKNLQPESVFTQPANKVDLARAEQLRNVATEQTESGKKNQSVETAAKAANLQAKRQRVPMGVKIPTVEEIASQTAPVPEPTINAESLAGGRAAMGLPPTEETRQAQGEVAKNVIESATTGSRKMPIPAFDTTKAQFPPGIRLSSVGELTDLTNEYLNRPDIPKTRAEAFAAGVTADSVNTLNDMFLSPVGLASAGTGLVAANALAKAGKAGTEALKLAEEYQAMQRAGATPAELLIQQGKVQQAIQAAAKAQGTVKTAAGIGRAGGAGFAAQGGNSFVEGIKDKDPSKVLSGLAQIVLAGAGEAGIRRAGGIENIIKAQTAKAATEGFANEQPVTGAVRTPQVPETPGAESVQEPAALLEKELGQAKAEVAADNLEKAAEELRKAAKVPKEPSKQVEKQEEPTKELAVAGETPAQTERKPSSKAETATQERPAAAGSAETPTSVQQAAPAEKSLEPGAGITDEEKALLREKNDLVRERDLGKPQPARLRQIESRIVELQDQLQSAEDKRMKALPSVEVSLEKVPRGTSVKGAQRVPFAKTKAVEAPATTAQEPEKATPNQKTVTQEESPKTIEEIPETFKAENLKPGQSTIEAYKDNPERVKLRDTIENKQLEKIPSVPEGQQPTAVVLGGGTASGKTTAKQAAFEKADQYVSVDADELKLSIPEYEELKKTDPAKAGARVHDESKLMAQNTVRKAMAERKNILYDGSTSGEDKPAFIKELKGAGYKVKLNFVDIPTEEAIRRANQRAKTSKNPINKGRIVPEEVIREKHQNAAKSFEKLKDLADEVRLYDNSGPAPELVYERIGTNPEKVYNQEKYEAFQRKAESTEAAPAKRAGTRAVQERVPEEARVSAEPASPGVVERTEEPTTAVKRKVPFAKVKNVEPTKPEGTAGELPAIAESTQPSDEVLEGKSTEGVQRTAEGGAGEAGAISGGTDRTGGGTGSERVGGERVSVPKSLSGAGGQQPVRRVRAGSQLKPSSNAVGNDYHISAEDHLGEGGIGAKFEDNVAAIETLKKIEKENRKATPSEQKILVKYVGWGGMPQAFDPYRREWNTKFNQLKQLLTEEEYDAARGSTQFAHFTSENVVKFIYDGLARMGFEGGRILEPAAGTGNFLGIMPVEIGANSKRVAVEIDPLSGRIAQQLYQNADVRISPFEKVRFPQNFFDLVATNVPFSDVKPFDKNYEKLKLNLHNYFMVRSLDLLRPGGIQAVITSRYTMDSVDERARGLLADRADLIAAFRLPDTAFKENANTEVVTDILFLKKRGPDEERGGEDFAKVVPMDVKDEGTIEQTTYKVNEYFEKHPENVLGKLTSKGTMYGPGQLNVELAASELPAKLKAALDKIPESAYEKYVAPDKTSDNFEQMIAEKREVKPFGHVIQDKKVWQNDMVGERTLPSGAKEPIFELVERKDLSPKQVKMVSGAMVMRDHARNILTSEYQDKSPAEISGNRRKLTEAYDKFVKKFGPINSQGTARILHDDPDYPLLQALEKYDPRTKEAGKADIFFKRTVSGKTAPTLATAKDGMLYSLAETGKLDWNLMADKLKKSIDEVRNDLQEQGLVFKNPEGDWETSDDYLSGNVREKLASAEAAAALDKQYQKNVDALKPIVPRDLTPGEIAVRLGATWIPPKVIEQFAAEILHVAGRDTHVTYSPSPSKWIVKAGFGKEGAINRDTWGTKDFYGTDLLEAALNMQSPKAYDREGDKSVVNPDRTLAAQEKQANLLKRFSEWVWEDTDRADQLSRLYNDNYNSTVPWNGSGQHLTLPTLAAGKTLHPWVKDGIWRLMRQPTAYIAYEVGLGKTLVYLGGALEAKRIGKFRKPMIVAHNATIQGYQADAKAFFPTSNVLVVTKDDLKAGNRQRFMARIATGDWDAVIVPHSSFGLLPARPETYERHMMGEIRAAREWLTLNKDDMDRKTVKQIEKAMDRIETKIEKKIEKLKSKQDTTVFFEDLGVDALLVDEADVFKNLMFQTQMTRVSGLGSPEGSDRALDLLMKSRLMMERNNGAGVYFASGTPLSNSIAEVYSIQKYLQPRELEKLGISQFDAWAANFGNVIQQLESSPEDPTKFRVTSSFAEFNNLPDLARMWRGISDYRTGEMVGIKRPKVNVDYRALNASPEQLNYISDELVPRSEAIRTRKVEPDEDNMLNVTTDGRKSALDMRLVDPSADDFPGGKITQLADDIVKEWKGSEERKGVQLVALDFSTPADRTPGKFMAYGDLTDKLVRRGIPREEIGWIHDADTDAKLATFIEKVNTGKLRVILGSTNKMGVGMNLQKKAIGIHHVDVGWRPRDLEQRRGRVERFGNENDEVFERFWTTKKTFDAYMLQKNETKAKFIHRFLKGELTQRKGVEDISGRALTFGELKGITTGRPEVMEKNKVDLQLDKLQRLSAQHEIEQTNMRVKVGRARSSIDALHEDLAAATADIKTASQKPTEFTAKIGKSRFDDRKEAGAALIDALAKADQFRKEKIEKVGEYSDFDIMVTGGPDLTARPFLRGKLDYSISRSEDPVGIMRSMENRVDSMTAVRQGTEQRLAKTQSDIAELEGQIGKPFPKQEEMNELVKRSMELAKILGMKEDDAQAAMAKEEKPETPVATDIEDRGADNTIFTKEKKEAAEKRFRSKMLVSRAGLDPTMLKDLAEIGGFYLEAGVRDFADWSKELLEHFSGTKEAAQIQPHLKEIYERAIKAGEKQKPGFAANIRLSNVKAAQDVIDVIRETARSQAGRISEQSRGQVPFSKTKERAEQLVRDGHMREKDLANMKKGTALNDAELKAARSILIAISEDVAKALKQFKDDDSRDNLLRVMELVKRQRAVQAAVSGATAEAGRALNSMKIAAEALRAKSAKDKALESLGGELTEDMVRRLAQIPENDYMAMNRFIRDHTKFSNMEKLNSYWIANILSGWQTHARVALSNAVWATTQIGIRPLRGLIDAPVSRIMGTERKYYPGETIPAMIGWFEGIPEGLRKALWIMQHGYSLDNVTGEILTDVGAPRYYEFPGGLKNPFNYPGRALMAAHNLFRVASLESELAAIAARKALRDGGLSGARERYAANRANPEVEDIDQARDFARYTAFLDKPDSFSRMLIRMREWQVPPEWNIVGGVKPLRFIIPFINLPWNIFKAGVEVTPAGTLKFLSKEARKEPGKASDILAKALIGAGIMAAAAILAMNGKLTGPAPKEAGKREEFYRLGKKPYSFRVGDTWYPYLRWSGPFGIPIATTAAWFDKYDSDGTVPTQERVTNAASAVGRATFDQSYFTGIANMLDAIREGKTYSAKFLADISSGFVPFSGMQKNIVQQTDVYRDARTIEEKVEAGIPFLSQTLKPQRDIFGRTTPQGVTGKATKDAIDLELARIGIQPGPLQDKIRVNQLEFDLSPAGTDYYHKMTGEALYGVLSDIIKSAGYQNANDYEKAKKVDHQVTEVRSAGKLVMLAKLKDNPDFRATPMFKLKVPFARKTEAAPRNP